MNRFVARRLRALQNLVLTLIFAAGASACGAPSGVAASAPIGSSEPTSAASASEASPTWGADDAPVTVVQFADLECPYTARVAPTVAQIQATYGPSRVRIVWRHSPLPFHHSARAAHEAAATVFALAGNKAFFDFNALALAHQDQLTESMFEAWAAEVGVNRERFVRARQANTEARRVNNDLALAHEHGITGTPTFLVNGLPVPGAYPFEHFQKVIDAELEETQKLLASGVATRDISTLRTLRNFKPPAEPDPEPKAAAKKDDDTTAWQVPIAADDPVRGSPKALVTIVTWSEYQCPFCARLEPTLSKIRETYGDQVRLVWKDNPLPFHAQAIPAAMLARVAYATKGPDVFWQVHDALFENQHDLGDEALKALAAKFGIAYAQVEKGNLHDQAQLKIDQSMSEAADRMVAGTPHSFINGMRLSGAQSFEKFAVVIEAELKKARAVQARGIPAEGVYAEIMKQATPPEAPERREVEPADATSPFRGNAKAKVTIQEFSDFQCPFCKRVNPTLEELEKEFGANLKRVFRHMPLPFHKDAPLAAEASLEAFAQKGNAGFWAYHDALFAAQQDDGGLERPNLEAIAKKLHLNMPRFRAALDSKRHEAKLKADGAAAAKAGISGTPGFVINGYFVAGAQAPSVFRRLIRRALAEPAAAP